MTTIQNEDRENQLTPCDILSLAFMILHAFLESLEHFWRGKSSFWMAKLQETLKETHFQSSKLSIKKIYIAYSGTSMKRRAKGLAKNVCYNEVSIIIWRFFSIHFYNTKLVKKIITERHLYIVDLRHPSKCGSHNSVMSFVIPRALLYRSSFNI